MRIDNENSADRLIPLSHAYNAKLAIDYECASLVGELETPAIILNAQFYQVDIVFHYYQCLVCPGMLAHVVQNLLQYPEDIDLYIRFEFYYRSLNVYLGNDICLLVEPADKPS